MESSCETEHDGSLLYKYINILVRFEINQEQFSMLRPDFQRFGARHLDSDGSCLIRMEKDGPTKTSGPHIVAISVNT